MQIFVTSGSSQLMRYFNLNFFHQEIIKRNEIAINSEKK